MSFYEGLRDNTATKLITKFGRSHTFTRITKGAYDPVTGTSAKTESTFTAYAVKEQFSAYERNNTSIGITDIKFMAEAVSEGFEVGDRVTIEGEEYKVSFVDPIKPASVVVAYNLRVVK